MTPLEARLDALAAQVKALAQEAEETAALVEQLEAEVSDLEEKIEQNKIDLGRELDDAMRSVAEDTHGLDGRITDLERKS